MDYTHSTQVRKPAKTLPSATAEEIRVSPAILKTFYSGAIESVLTASQCGMETAPIRTAKLCRESCA